MSSTHDGTDPHSKPWLAKEESAAWNDPTAQMARLQQELRELRKDKERLDRLEQPDVHVVIHVDGKLLILKPYSWDDSLRDAIDAAMRSSP